MKPLLLLFISFFFIACNKQNQPPGGDPTDTTGNEPAIQTDTLSAGWTKIILPDKTPLVDIFFANNQLGYAIGDIYLYKSTDGGLTWIKYDSTASPDGDNLAVTLNGNAFISSGYDNAIFKATYGNNIQAQKIENIHGDADIFFTSNDTGYISHGYSGDKEGLWKTVNGGNTWAFIPI